MKELNIKETKTMYAGGFSANMVGFLLKGLNFFTDLGRYLGSSIRRIYDNNLCDYASTTNYVLGIISIILFVLSIILIIECIISLRKSKKQEV